MFRSAIHLNEEPSLPTTLSSLLLESLFLPYILILQSLHPAIFPIFPMHYFVPSISSSASPSPSPPMHHHLLQLSLFFVNIAQGSGSMKRRFEVHRIATRIGLLASS